MDTHFYYYATCLAARLAGMAPDECQQLAYYCQTMSEMHSGITAQKRWQYKNYRFMPFMMAARQADHVRCEDNARFEYKLQLAFRALPALLPAKQLAIVTPQCVPPQTQATSGSGNAYPPQVTRHYYNPLTDVDWKHGGQFKPDFSRKLAKQQQAADRQQGLEMPDVPRQADHFTGKPNELRLNCTANSQFARDMLNDSICKSRYRSPVKGMELALLGCRLSVYQNSWQSAEISKLNNGEQQKRGALLREAFYWSMYVIHCFLHNTTVQKSRPASEIENNPVLTQQLSELFLLQGTSLQGEYGWLSQFSQLMSEPGQPFSNWQEGLRYRPAHLFEQAMRQSGAEQTLQITDLQAFKESAFYKLNCAAQYQLDWLARHLTAHGLAAYACSQQLGEANLWQQEEKRKGYDAIF